MMLLRSAVLLLSVLPCAADRPAPGAPTPEQIAWHEMEIEMFLCLDPCTWQGREYDDHSTPLSEINPSELDTDQWCEVAQSFGAKQILFVAKHTGGFCWWQTDTSEYSIKNTPYKDGKGDVLAELAESCRKHGLKLGVYIYPGDDQWGAGIGSGGRTEDPAKQEAYNKVLRQQWTEVLTRYGDVAEVWFDGSCVIEVGDILKAHAPKAMVFQGPHATLRWPGSEKGIAPYPTWQTVKGEHARSGVSTGAHSDPDGDVWLPMEMDTPLLDHKWFWGPDTDHMMKSLDHLMEIYYGSVGRGCVLLLNATPDTSGRIPDSHVQRYREFGEAIGRIYENMRGETSGTGDNLELHFDAPTHVDHVVTMEDIRLGHVVRGYRIDGLIEGEWRALAEGSSVGHKRIDRLPGVVVEALRLRITDAAGTPVIKSLGAYDAPEAVEPEGGVGAASPEWQDVVAWDLITLTSEWQSAEVDLTPHIRRPGQYVLEFYCAEGPAGAEAKEITAVVSDTVAPEAVSALAPNRWLVRRTDQVTPDAQGRTAIRMRVREGEPAAGKTRLRIRALE